MVELERLAVDFQGIPSAALRGRRRSLAKFSMRSAVTARPWAAQFLALKPGRERRRQVHGAGNLERRAIAAHISSTARSSGRPSEDASPQCPGRARP